jgi:hypothetical protein
MANSYTPEAIQQALQRIRERPTSFNSQLLLAKSITYQIADANQVLPTNAVNLLEQEQVQVPTYATRRAAPAQASRIRINNFRCEFTIRGRRFGSPFFIIAYAFFKTLQRAAEVMRRAHNNVYMKSFQLYVRVGREGAMDEDGYNTLQRRVEVPLRSEFTTQLNSPQGEFTPECLNFLSGHVAMLLAEERYSESDLVDRIQEAIDFGGARPRAEAPNAAERLRSSVAEVRLEATCFYAQFNSNPNVVAGRLNQFANIRRWRGNFGGGKRKMFYHGNEVQFHTQAKESLECVHINPLNEGNHCFPMAFLTSQVREVTLKEGECSERLSKPHEVSKITHSLSTYPYLTIPYNDLDHPIPEFTKHRNMILFNPIRTQDYLAWESAAKYLHSYMESQLGYEVDHTSWEECPQAYSDFFNVTIHVFIKGEKGRFDVYQPKDKKDIVRHIYMYCDDGHFNPVFDLRVFTHSLCDAPFTWCDCCQQRIPKSQPSEKRCQHIKTCNVSSNYVSQPTAEFLNMATREAGTTVRKINATAEFCNMHQTFDCECDNYSIGNKVSEHVYQCTVCDQFGSFKCFAHKHRCYFKVPKPKTPVDNTKLFVLDIEGMQVFHRDKRKYEHQFVLLCVRNVYDETIKKEYFTTKEFIDDCNSNPIYKDAVMIAHNGGGYDYQYFVREMEAMGVEYSFIPRPGSDHKYIQVTMTFAEHSIRLIDFMCLIPGSLRGIAQSFQLPIQKGDFPHRFLNPDTLAYVGALPPIDSEEDFFSLKWKKSDEDVEELKIWYTEQTTKYCTCRSTCTCMKQKWDCRAFLTEYCWMDVDVLAQACQKYRDLLMNPAAMESSWKLTPVDPFCYLTQSQLAMTIFLSGFEEIPRLGITIPRRHNLNKAQFVWYHRLQVAQPRNTFVHYGTNSTRYMWVNKNTYIDCFCLETQTVYLFFGTMERDLPETDDKINLWLEERERGFIRAVEIMYEEELGEVTEMERNIANICDDRDFFFGGRTEVFSPYARPSAEEEIKYIDVCSLYPTICSFAMLPIGHPTIYFGNQCDLTRLNPSADDPYFGYVRCKVIPNKNDRLGLLPSKMENGRLVFNLNDKIGMWFTEEIYLAMQCGYVITEIYEVHHFDRDNRSDTLMRGYMEAFLTLKQEAEGWKKLGASSDQPSEEEQIRILEELYESNGRIGRAKKENVKKNPVLRQVSKIFLNCLWGKFSQRKKLEFFSELTSYKDYEAILDSPESGNMVFRQMNHGRWRVKFTKPDYLLPPNTKYNIYLAAGVTAQARCYLHRQMLKIGPERILYCDTDSIVHLYPKSAPSLVGIGLGKWTDEHPNENIIEFMAVAPKCYMLNIEGDTVMKAKGCIMSVENRKLLSTEVVKGLIQSFCTQKQLESVTLQNFSIFTNSTDIDFRYGTMFSRYNEKQVRCVLNKRQLVAELDPDDTLGESITRVSLFPEGFTSL